MKLSIIVPVFNVEKYVEKCILSCIKQDIPSTEYEIIVINDGTQDNSLEIVQEIAKNHKNIKIYSQENAGLSVARNVGLSLSTGEYVWFIDSDDWIETNCLSLIINHITDNDLLAIGYVKFYDDEKHTKFYSPTSNKISTGKDLLKQDFFTQVPFYIYRRRFLLENKLKFKEGIYHEDSEFTPRALYAAEKAEVLSQNLYYVYKRSDSITTTPSIKRVFDLIIVANSLNDFKNTIQNDLEPKFNDLISLALNNALFLSYSIEKKHVADMNKAFFNSRHLFICLKESNIAKYRLEGFLFDLFPKRVVQIYKVLQKANTKRSSEKVKN